MFKRLRNRMARQPKVAQEAPVKAEKPVIVPVWDDRGEPVIESYVLAMMPEDHLTGMIEQFDAGIEEVILQLRSHQDYALVALTFIGVLEAALELAAREAA